MKSKKLADITPGEILDEEFLKPMGITQYRIAMDIGVPPRRINEIIKGQRAITADTALRLGRVSHELGRNENPPSVSTTKTRRTHEEPSQAHPGRLRDRDQPHTAPS